MEYGARGKTFALNLRLRKKYKCVIIVTTIAVVPVFLTFCSAVPEAVAAATIRAIHADAIPTVAAATDADSTTITMRSNMV